MASESGTPILKLEWQKGIARDAAATPAVLGRAEGYDGGLAGGDLLDRKDKTIYFGAAGGLGDTGVSYFIQVRNKKSAKTTVTQSHQDKWDKYISDLEAWAKYAYRPPADGESAVITTINRTNGRLTGEDGAAVATPVNTRTHRPGDPIVKEPTLVRRPGVDPDTTAAMLASANIATETVDGVTQLVVDDEQLAKDQVRGTMKDTSKNTPWVFGLSRSLGGGASVHLEYQNNDDDAKKNVTGLWLKVDF